jgi:hypothetical protein
LGVDVVCPVDGVSVDVDLIGVKEVDVKGFVGVGVGVLATGGFGGGGLEVGGGRGDLIGERAVVMAWSFFNWLGEIENTWLTAILMGVSNKMS